MRNPKNSYQPSINFAKALISEDIIEKIVENK